MKMPNMTKTIKTAGKLLHNNRAAILTGIGLAGGVTTVILAVRATPKAMRRIEEAEKQKAAENNKSAAQLNKAETVKATWKCYIPAALMGLSSAGCIVAAAADNHKKISTLMTVCQMSQTALSEYKDKAIEVLGEKDEKEKVEDKLAKDHIDKNPVDSGSVVIANGGTTLCYDYISGRYFKSDVTTIQSAANRLNRQMVNADMYISLNDFYDELGLDRIPIGDALGWNVNDGLIDVKFGSHLAADNTPCLVLEYYNDPSYGYDRL